MHFFRDKDKVSFIAFMADFVFINTGHNILTSQIKVEIIFIAHDFRIGNHRLHQILGILADIQIRELDILTTDAHDGFFFAR